MDALTVLCVDDRPQLLELRLVDEYLTRSDTSERLIPAIEQAIRRSQTGKKHKPAARTRSA